MGTFMPHGGLRNDDAARSCGFSNRLQWAAFKKRKGIHRVKTRRGMRYVLDFSQRKAGQRTSAALKQHEAAADARCQQEADSITGRAA